MLPDRIKTLELGEVVDHPVGLGLFHGRDHRLITIRNFGEGPDDVGRTMRAHPLCEKIHDREIGERGDPLILVGMLFHVFEHFGHHRGVVRQDEEPGAVTVKGGGMGVLEGHRHGN